MISRRAERLAKTLEHVASAALVVMMMVTVVDVLMRNAMNRPITGAIEMVQIAMIYLVSLAIPQTFLARHHVQVDVIDQMVRKRTLVWLDLLGEICGVALLGVMLWVMVHEARDAHDLGDTTADLFIPVIVLWAPLVIGTACSVAAVLLLLVDDLRQLRSREG